MTAVLLPPPVVEVKGAAAPPALLLLPACCCRPGRSSSPRASPSHDGRLELRTLAFLGPKDSCSDRVRSDETTSHVYFIFIPALLLVSSLCFQEYEDTQVLKKTVRMIPTFAGFFSTPAEEERRDSKDL